MTDPKPNVIDSYLYEQQNLKVWNTKKQLEKHQGILLRECFKLRGIELDEDTWNDYETKIFGE